MAQKIHPDAQSALAGLAIVKAWKGDSYGNLVYRKSARNFNPMAATCGRVTVAEREANRAAYPSKEVV